MTSSPPASAGANAPTLLVDFGSTFTKLALVDTAEGALLAAAQAPTTVQNVTDGLAAAAAALPASGDLSTVPIMASSSAAGGLCIAAIGLVPELTAKAARQAALGAGARVDQVFSFEIDSFDLRAIEEQAPDMILLVGGSDGGNRKVIEAKARRLATLKGNAPIVRAGNRRAREAVLAVLTAAGKEVLVTEYVVAGLEVLNIEPAREAIRDLFMRHLPHAKGIDTAEALVGNVVMPTPMAVLGAARLLAEGVDGEPGIGSVIVIDIGGATTDAHSVAPNRPAEDGVLLRGLEEPIAKRTVEGDLGIRINAANIVNIHGPKRVAAAAPEDSPVDAAALQARVATGSATPARLPTESEIAIDAALARTAAKTPIERHIGRIEVLNTAHGKVLVQYGKSVVCCSTVIGTGGVFAYGPHARHILSGVAAEAGEELSLRPVDPRYLVDRSYVLFAGGLLSRDAPVAALRLLKRHLTGVN